MAVYSISEEIEKLRARQHWTPVDVEGETVDRIFGSPGLVDLDRLDLCREILARPPVADGA